MTPVPNLKTILLSRVWNFCNLLFNCVNEMILHSFQYCDTLVDACCLIVTSHFNNSLSYWHYKLGGVIKLSSIVILFLSKKMQALKVCDFTYN